MTVYTPQQNIVSERLNLIVLKKVLYGRKELLKKALGIWLLATKIHHTNMAIPWGEKHSNNLSGKNALYMKKTANKEIQFLISFPCFVTCELQNNITFTIDMIFQWNLYWKIANIPIHTH